MKCCGDEGLDCIIKLAAELLNWFAGLEQRVEKMHNIFVRMHAILPECAPEGLPC